MRIDALGKGRTMEMVQEALDAIYRAERLTLQSERDVGGGVCIWHKFSPEQIGKIGEALIDARYAVEAIKRHGTVNPD